MRTAAGEIRSIAAPRFALHRSAFQAGQRRTAALRGASISVAPGIHTLFKRASSSFRLRRSSLTEQATGLDCSVFGKGWQFVRGRLPPYRVLRWCAALALVGVLTSGCRTLTPFRRGGRDVQIVVTAYCACGKCCGWKRNWRGRPVYAYGELAGRPKQVGICADGSKARKGTAAADTRYYPFGTRMHIPGYGRATVHDRGGNIKGPNRLDVFFPSHRQALLWGRRKLSVRILEGR